jgi:integrase
LKPPRAGFDEYWDSETKGLCLRIFASGQATWSFRYRPHDGAGRKRIRLGEFPSIGLAEARRRAAKFRGEVAGGADPQAERRAKRDAKSLAELIEEYLVEVEAKKKPRTYSLYKWYLTELVPERLQSKKAVAVSVADLEKLHRDIGEETPATANRVLICVQGVYTFGGRHGDVPKGFNPATGIEKYPEKGRERFLSNEELGRLGAALIEAETVGLSWPETDKQNKHQRKDENRKTVLSPYVTAAIRLLLFTGCRLREILNLKFDEVDLQRGLLLLPDSKNGKRAVVLNAPAIEIIRQLPVVGEFVIAGDHPKKPRSDLKRPWDLIRRRTGLSDVRLHDLRHTHASIGAGEGLSLPIIGKLLGHRHAETTQRYAHLADDPTRRASEMIGAALSSALKKRAA